MLSAAVRRTSRDVSIMKEKLIFSGVQPYRQAEAGTELFSAFCMFPCNTYRQGHGTDTRITTQFHAHT